MSIIFIWLDIVSNVCGATVAANIADDTTAEKNDLSHTLAEPAVDDEENEVDAPDEKLIVANVADDAKDSDGADDATEESAEENEIRSNDDGNPVKADDEQTKLDIQHALLSKDDIKNDVKDNDNKDSITDTVVQDTSDRDNNSGDARANENAPTDTTSTMKIVKKPDTYYDVYDGKTRSTAPVSIVMHQQYQSEIADNQNILKPFDDQRIIILKAISNLSTSMSRSIWDLQDNETLTALLNIIDRPQENFKNIVNMELQKLLAEMAAHTAAIATIIQRSGYEDLETIQKRVVTWDVEINNKIPDEQSRNNQVADDICNRLPLPQTEKMSEVYVNSYRDVCISAFQNRIAKSVEEAQTAFTDVFSMVETLVGTLFTRQLPDPAQSKREDLKQVKWINIINNKLFS